MRLAMLTDGIPPWTMGGMQKHSRLTAEYLGRRGVLIELFVPHQPENKITNEEVIASFSPSSRENITVHLFAYEDRGFMPGHYLRSQHRLSIKMFDALKMIEPVDFVYCKGFMGSYISQHKSELPFPTSLGVNFHGMNMYQKQPNLKGEFTKFMLRKEVEGIMKSSDYVFSYGGRVSEIISGILDGDSRILEVPAGIEADQIRTQIKPSAEKVNFVFIGRHDRVKGLPELYTALKHVSNSEWTLKIIGPIPEKDQIKTINITYEGQVNSKEEMNLILDECDVLLCPSISEGMPNVILEAMARGLAVIATDVGAVKLLVDNSVGILIPPADNLSLSSSITRVISMNASHIDAWKNNSIQRIVANFTMEKTVDRLLTIFNSLESRN